MVPIPAPVLVQDPGNIQQFPKKHLYKILPFKCQKQHYFPESWPLIFDIFTFLFHFMLYPDPNPEPDLEPQCIPVPVPLRQKVTVPAVLVPVP